MFHIVSDLHIDNWDTSLPNAYPAGSRGDYPVFWREYLDTILIVAGDTSDNFDLTLKYLQKVAQKYKKVVFIDGNHESVDVYPRLFSMEEMLTKVQACDDKKLVFLNEKPHIIGEVAIVGACGWWDYNQTHTKAHDNYFQGWIDFNPDEVNRFHQEVLTRAEEEFNYIVKCLDDLHNRPDVKAIMLVTHTIPHRRYRKELLPGGKTNSDFDFLLNTRFESITKESYPKVSHWIFGHVHCFWDEIVNGIRYVSNPRGRVEDYNRVEYYPLSLSISLSRSSRGSTMALAGLKKIRFI